MKVDSFIHRYSKPSVQLRIQPSFPRFESPSSSIPRLTRPAMSSLIVSPILRGLAWSVSVLSSIFSLIWFKFVPKNLRLALTDFMTEHRGWFVVFFVVPLSLMFDAFFAVRAWIVLKFYSAPELHEERVRDIQAQVKVWCTNEKLRASKPRMCTARGGWQSISPGFRDYKSKSYQVRVNMYDILGMEDGCVVAEPMVNMGQLSHYLIPRGYTLPVLPEMDDLTVGGLIMGVGIETSSHIHGLFNDSVVELEVVTASGDVVKCSRSENRELFDAIPWSYGTLGFLVSAKIRVVPSKEYVHMRYVPCYTHEDLVRVFEEETCKKDPHQFVEALVYSKKRAVVLLGDFCSKKEMYEIFDPQRVLDVVLP